MRRLLLAIALLAALAVAGLWAVDGWLAAPFKGWDGDECFVDIPPGSSTRVIGQSLASAGVIRDATLFRMALWRSGAARRLKAGEYRFDRALGPREVIARLAAGDVFLRTITFPEGLTIAEMAGLYEARGFGPASELVEASSNEGLVSDLDPAAHDLEGYLFPETYALTRHASATTLVAMMVKRFREVVR